MSHTILFSLKALEDYDEARLWYQNHNETAKSNFEKAIGQGLSKIETSPKAYSPRFEDVRMMPMKKFPYLICYRVDDIKKIVTVIAVWHQAKDRDALQYR